MTSPPAGATGGGWAVQTPEVSQLSGISCLSTPLCMAVYGSTAVESTNGGSSWSATSQATGDSLTAVSCYVPDSAECIAVGSNGGSGPGAAYFGEGGWTSIPVLVESPTVLTGVSCTIGIIVTPRVQPRTPSPTPYCVAVGDRGGALVVNDTNGGDFIDESSAVPTESGTEGTTAYSITDVSCAGTVCVAVGEWGSGTGPGLAIESTDGGNTWSDVSTGLNINEELDSVWCTDSPQLFCMATGANYGEEQIGAHTFDGTSWTDRTLGLPAIQSWLTGVSCADSSHCVAVGSTITSISGVAGPAVFPHAPPPGESMIFATSNAGSSWTDQSSDLSGSDIHAYSTVSCLSNRNCWLVGSSSESGTADAFSANPFGASAGPGTPPLPPPNSCGYTYSNTSSTQDGEAVAEDQGVTATATGTGGVTVSDYCTNPAGPPTFEATGNYFDVAVSTPNTFSTVVIQDCATGVGPYLAWWNSSTSTWEPVIGDPGPTYSAGPPPCTTVTLDSTTSPSIAELTGTIFSSSSSPVPASAASGSGGGSGGSGYWLEGSDGGVFAFGGAGYFGSLPGSGVHVSDIVDLTRTLDTGGYWLTGSDGGVFAFGDAPYFGSLPGRGVHVGDIVGMRASADDGGYVLAGSDGGVFAFGDAGYFGSLPGNGVHVGDIVGLARTTDGGGYWLVGSDGGVFAFGDAGYFGSLPGSGVHVGDIVGLVRTADGGGYWLVGSDGGVFAFGDAPYLGSLPADGIHVTDVVGMSRPAGSGGYWLVGSDGGVFAFGDAPYLGSLPGDGVRVSDIRGIAG